MEQHTHAAWGIAGAGKLGKALLTQFDQAGSRTGIYHPDQKKAAATAEGFTHAYELTKEEIASLDYLILALPADQIANFTDDCLQSEINIENCILINLATKQSTEELKQAYPALSWTGVKLVGHAEHLRKYGEGLFVTESALKDAQIMNRFSSAGRLIEDNEQKVEELNKYVTAHAVKAVRELERNMHDNGHDPLYIEQAMRAVMPEVIRAYSKGELGQFAKKIVEDMEKE